jgi:Chaperone of endosialidase
MFSKSDSFNLSVIHPLFGDAIQYPEIIKAPFPGTASIYQGYFGPGATPLLGTGSLVGGPSVAPFTTNFLGVGLFTGAHTTVGSDVSIGTKVNLGAADVSLSAILSGLNLFRGKVVPKEDTVTPDYYVNALSSTINTATLFQAFCGFNVSITMNPALGSLTGTWALNGSAICVAPCSDERAKTNVVELESSLDKILNLKGVSFDWNSEVVPTLAAEQDRQIGLIAQEVEKIVPEVVSIEKVEGQELKSVRYENIVALLIEGMKEQQQQIEDLKQRVAELESNK